MKRYVDTLLGKHPHTTRTAGRLADFGYSYTLSSGLNAQKKNSLRFAFFIFTDA